jgi:hypothetical protein
MTTKTGRVCLLSSPQPNYPISRSARWICLVPVTTRYRADSAGVARLPLPGSSLVSLQEAPQRNVSGWLWSQHPGGSSWPLRDYPILRSARWICLVPVTTRYRADSAGVARLPLVDDVQEQQWRVRGTQEVLSFLYRKRHKETSAVGYGR